VVARARDGRLVGGLYGETRWGWLKVSTLFVVADCRRSGVGRRMLLAAEAEARDRGCTGVRLDTFSFQAPGFYERLGYRRFGELPGYPPASDPAGRYSRIYYWKPLGKPR
jgi:ribosomal protein S18 acetylase RimI-like enzyme